MSIHKIQELETMPGFILSVIFDNGVKKLIDCNPYLKLPVFQVLKEYNNFKSVRNCGYFIEWAGHEIDLSADTLWIDGKNV